MKKIDLILQGPFNDYAYEIAVHYLQLEFVNKIILSCWEQDRVYNKHPDRIIIVKSKDLFGGVGNRNRQIKSSLEGLKRSTTEFSVKLRSDQKISLSSMRTMFIFYEKHKIQPLRFEGNSQKPFNTICVAGIFRPFPFHPRDHIFWGNTQDLIDVFSIPYDNESTDQDYSRWLRAEAYLCMWYYARFDKQINKYIERYQEYLVDSAPFLKEALEKSNELGPKVFKPFPRIDFEWPKHGLANYHYDFTEREYGEYWDEGK